MNPNTLSGGCLCGSVRYEISAEPTTLYACHCADCQKASGSSFVLAMRVPHEGIAAVSGTPKSFVRTRSDGRRKEIMRCPDCLTALWGARVEKPDYVTVYAGTLDSAPSLEPVVHIWTDDAQPWISLPENTLRFPQNAPDKEVFARAWKERFSKSPRKTEGVIEPHNP